MTLTLKSTLDYNLPLLTQILNQSFVNYMVDVQVKPPLLAQMIRQEAIDLASSRLVQKDEAVVGLALIGRRGWTSRLAAMAVRPAWRRQGIGRWFMEKLLKEARKRGDHRMVLEVIEQNEAAVKLYEAVGFRQQRRLVGYSAPQPKGVVDPHLEAVDISEVARHLITYGPSDLPWQISGETLAQIALPNQGYRLGPAYAAISNPAHAPISLRALVVPEKAQPQMWATRLLQAMIAQHPNQPWRIPTLFPEELIRGLFEGLGFEREPLTQWQMRLELS